LGGFQICDRRLGDLFDLVRQLARVAIDVRLSSPRR
jgi:hypothetical protein